MSWEPTTDQILNLDGVRRRVDRFRFELCDPRLIPIGELHPDREDSTPSIENDGTNTTSRRLRGLKLLPDEASDVNVLRDRLRVYMVLQNDVEFRLGTFRWADNNRPMRSWGDESHSDLVDDTHILNQQSTRAYGWGRGANIALMVIFLVTQAGFTVEDLAPMHGTPMRTTLAEPKAWQPGTTWYQMLSDLAALMGFAIWFDRDGLLYVDEPPDPDVSPPTVPAYETNTRILADSIVPSDELLTAANDFALFDAGTDRMRVGRYQLPVSAPHSAVNRGGWRIGLTESVQGLASQAQADKGARNLARTEGVAYEWLQFSSTADPRHDTWEVVPAFGSNWLEVAWGLELRSGGAMTHKLKRPLYEPT